MNTSFKKIILGALLLLAAHLVLYHPALTTGYFHADDWHNYAFFQQYSFADYALGEWGQGRRGDGGYYRPLSRLYFNANYTLFNLWAPGHHLSNMILHYFNVLLFWAIARRLLRSPRLAFPAALLFLCFPAHPSAVHWISGATDLVHAFWYLAAINFALAARMGPPGEPGARRPPCWALGAGALGCFLCALLSKETAAGLPVVIIAIEAMVARVNKSNYQQSTLKFFISRFALSLAAFALLAAYLLFRRLLLGNPDAHIAAVLGRGLIGPSLLSFVSSLITLYSPSWSPANLAAYLILLGALLWTLRRSPGGIIAAVWLLMAIAPMTGIIVSITNGGWLLYLPAAAWCLLLPEAIARISEAAFKTPLARCRAADSAIAVILLLYLSGAAIVEKRWDRASLSARAAVYSSMQILNNYANSHNFLFINPENKETQVLDSPGSNPKSDIRNPKSPIPVIIPQLSSPHDYPAPIFDPANSLHMALAALAPGSFDYRDYLMDNETSPTLVLICHDGIDTHDWLRTASRHLKSIQQRDQFPLTSYSRRHPYPFVSLFELGPAETRSWDGAELARQWQWGSGVAIEPTPPAGEPPTAIAAHITDPENNWMQSLPLSMSGASLNLFIFDYDTPVMTEGLVEWLRAPDQEPSGAVAPPSFSSLAPTQTVQPARPFLFNDPVSRVQPRRLLLYSSGRENLIGRVQPISEPGRVLWRSIEWRRHGLHLLDTTGLTIY